MKYTSLIALFASSVAAQDLDAPFCSDAQQKYDNDQPHLQRASRDLTYAETIGQRYLNGPVSNDNNEGFNFNRSYGKKHEALVDEKASRVAANYESCIIGHHIIPAFAESTHVKKAASFNSDKDQKYQIRGVAQNNYELKGSLEQTNQKQYKGCDKQTNSLSLRGNLQKKYCQDGNKELLNCQDGNALNSSLLDQEAIEVTEDPEAEVEELVNQKVRAAISKTISEAVKYAVSQSLDSMVNV